MKTTETVELTGRLDSTDHGDGRVESADERWRTNGGVERKGDEEGDDGRTDEADGSRRCGTSKDRQGQRTVEADGGRNNRRRIIQ